MAGHTKGTISGGEETPPIPTDEETTPQIPGNEKKPHPYRRINIKGDQPSVKLPLGGTTP